MGPHELLQTPCDCSIETRVEVWVCEKDRKTQGERERERERESAVRRRVLLWVYTNYVWHTGIVLKSHLLRAEMIHFIRNLHNYMMFEVLECAWYVCVICVSCARVRICMVCLLCDPAS